MVLSIRSLIGWLKKIKFPVKVKNWQDFEYFDPAWKERICEMAKHIPMDTNSIADVGCGKMWLKEYIPDTCVYHGIDYIYRGENCHVFDLNNYEFPTSFFDVIFVSGCLEYIQDYKWLIKEIATHCSACIISYCTTDLFKNSAERVSLGWVNHLQESELIKLFKTQHMLLRKKEITNTSNTLYVFVK